MTQAVKRNLLKLVGLAGLIAAIGYLGQTRNVADSGSPAMAGYNSIGQSANSGQSMPDNDLPYHGMAIQLSYTENGVKRYIKLIDQVAELGADTIKLSTAGYQEHAGSGYISLDLRKCPTRGDFAKLIRHAHSRGLRVIVMPVVLLNNPRGSEWRGVIQPDNWDTWFAEYLSFIKYFARVAAENNAEVLVVGSELISTETFTDQWIKIIAEVRKIYKGKLAYSANWDHYEGIQFWDKLDLIGMTTYHTLAQQENPPLETLLASWTEIKSEILNWQRKIGKPILFTEVGWCSQPGASIEAWNYYRHQLPSQEGLEEQEKCYQAFIQTWGHEPAVGGMIWWEWTSDPGGPDDYNYTPKGKPAEQVLRSWFIRQASRQRARINGLPVNTSKVSAEQQNHP